jgi:two-component system chemotaxis response regulator CheB
MHPNVKNRLEVLDYMMAQHSVPSMMISALTDEGAEVTAQDLEGGAVDSIAKPLEECSADTLGETVKFAEFPLVVIGASTGGPNLLKAIIRDLPASFPAALLIVQHMPKYFTKVFAENLDAVAAFPIYEAQDGDELRPGVGFVAPGDRHVLISREVNGSPKIRFVPNRLEYPYRPSIDCVMVSAAELFTQSTVGLILTGMGNDGLVGSQKIKEQGGMVLVQDEATSLMYGMPQAVAEAGVADAVLPDTQLAAALAQAVDSVCFATGHSRYPILEDSGP